MCSIGVVSRAWGLQFRQGEVLYDGNAMRAYRVTQLWIQQHIAYQASLWEEHRAQVRVFKKGHQIICQAGEVAEWGRHTLLKAWEERKAGWSAGVNAWAQ